jgi:PAS domain S-box-containing protein
LLEAAPDAMVVVNQAGEIVLLNVQAEIQFGYRRHELVGQKVKNIIPKGFAERLVADALRSTEDALAQQIGTGIELSGRHKNGSNFPIEIMLSPLESAEGILVTAAIRDITTRKEAEAHLLRKVDELNRSNEELGQFAYVASHDLQEPLRMVSSYCELLGERYRGKLDERADKFIGYAVDGARRMQRLISDLLQVSRVGTAAKPLRFTDVETVFTSVLESLQTTIQASQAVVVRENLPPVQADDGQLSQVFQNLIGNALKFHGERPPLIRVSAELIDGMVRFAVADNGIGMEKDTSGRIFQMFQRLHTREEYEGSGIGLAITKKIVERHGGTIWFESVLGEGTTFYFTIRVAAKEVDGGGAYSSAAGGR